MARLEYVRPSPYSTQTLVGNWFEEISAYEKQKHNHHSSYYDQFPPKPYSANNASLLWQNKLLYEGYDPRIMLDHEFPKYLENMSTTYDLSYNHFPYCMDGPNKRRYRARFLRYEPEQDYSLNYGNITNHGLLKIKKYDWYESKQDPRKTDISDYTDSYTPPKKEDISTTRFGLPSTNSSLMDRTNIELTQLNLRNTPTLSVPPNANLRMIPRPTRCNPITWECPPGTEEMLRKRCHPTKRLKR